MYYCGNPGTAIEVDSQYRPPGAAFVGWERDVFIDRKVAYDYAIGMIEDGIEKLREKIETYQVRRLGICRTIVNGETTVHEYNDENDYIRR